jgi:retron-type reverse transcriptase
MSERPKEVWYNNMATTGLPALLIKIINGEEIHHWKSNFHGTRNLIVYGNGENNYHKRRLVTSFNQKRHYSTGSRIKVVDRLYELNKRSKNYPNRIIDRNLYKDFILCPELFWIAYQKIRSNPGNMTPGISPATLDGISIETRNQIVEKLSDESFQFTAGRRILVPKAGGGTRPLTVGKPLDQLVQEVMRIVLEAIYEPLFCDESHGFRPGRGCHSALRAVLTKFKGTR